MPNNSPPLALCQPTTLDLAPALAVAKAALRGFLARGRCFDWMDSRSSTPLVDLDEALMNMRLLDASLRYVAAWYPELRERVLNEGIEQARMALIELVADLLTVVQLAHAKSIVVLNELNASLGACTRATR